MHGGRFKGETNPVPNHSTGDGFRIASSPDTAKRKESKGSRVFGKEVKGIAPCVGLLSVDAKACAERNFGPDSW